MAYRDSVGAARMRVQRLRDDVTACAEGISAALIPRLPTELRGRLERLEQRARGSGNDLDSWARVERDIRAFCEVIEDGVPARAGHRQAP